MDVLKPLRVFIETGEHREHFAQAERLMRTSSRLLCFTFVTPKLGRYTVPALCGYGDVALWIDNKAEIGFDIVQVWKHARWGEKCAVYVLAGERENPIPSLMFFRNKFCERLTPDYIFHATPDQLVPSVWAGGAGNVGALEV